MENFKDKKADDILEKLVHINRITKVVKGGRRFGFSALVVVGNQAGKIGIAHAKAKQVPDAIKKANEVARRKLIHIPLREGRTIHHDVKAKDGSGRIVLRAASKGTGIIAGGPVRAVCEVLGVMPSKSIYPSIGSFINFLLSKDINSVESTSVLLISINAISRLQINFLHLLLVVLEREPCYINIHKQRKDSLVFLLLD